MSDDTCDTLLGILKEGKAHLAIVLLNSGLKLPLVKEHPFLLNEFLIQSKDVGSHTYLTPQSAHPFYEGRMRVARTMMENGFLLQPMEAYERKSKRDEEHEVELLCRSYLSAGMGDILPIPQPEALDRVACLNCYLQDKSFAKKGLGGNAFSQFAYAEPMKFTRILLEEGFFDDALKNEAEQSLKVDLLSTKSSGAGRFFSTPNRYCRSLVIERCLDLGLLDYEDLKKQHFTLFDVGGCSSLTSKMMTQGGFLLPRVDEKTLDGRGPGWFYLWSNEQLKVWGEHDPEGMMLKIQFVQKDKESTFLTREEFKSVVLDHKASLGFTIVFEDENDEEVLTTQQRWEKEKQKQEQLRLVFADAESRVIKKQLMREMPLKPEVSPVHKM